LDFVGRPDNEIEVITKERLEGGRRPADHVTVPLNTAEQKRFHEWAVLVLV